MIKILNKNNFLKSFNLYILVLLISFFLSTIINFDYLNSVDYKKDFLKINDDELTYYLLGNALIEDKKPYKNIIEFKGPILFYFNYILVKISGQDLLIYRILGILIKSLTITNLIFFLKSKINKIKIFFSTFLLILIYYIIFTDGTSFLSEHVTNFFLTFLLFFIFKKKINDLDIIFISIFFSLLILTRQNYIFMLPIIYLILFFQKNKKVFLLFNFYTLVLCIGIIAPHIITSWENLYFSMFGYIKIFLQKKNIFINFLELANIINIYKFFNLQTILRFLFWLCFSFFFILNFKRDINFSIAIILISLSILINGSFQHYLIMLYPLTSITLINLMHKKNIINQKFIIFISIIFIFFTINNTKNLNKFNIYQYAKIKTPEEILQIVQFINKESLDKKKIFCTDRLIQVAGKFNSDNIFAHSSVLFRKDILENFYKINFNNTDVLISNSHYLILNVKTNEIKYFNVSNNFEVLKKFENYIILYNKNFR